MKNRDKRKRKVRAWHVILGIVVVMAALVGGVYLATEPGRAEVSALTFANIDFGKLQDGIFAGQYKGTKENFRDTDVEVTVSSGKVVKILAVGGACAGEKQSGDLGRGQSLNDLFNDVMKESTLQVDVVSGATLTSKSYLKAVEDALNKALSK